MESNAVDDTKSLEEHAIYQVDEAYIRAMSYLSDDFSNEIDLIDQRSDTLSSAINYANMNSEDVILSSGSFLDQESCQQR